MVLFSVVLPTIKTTLFKVGVCDGGIEEGLQH